MLTRIAGQLRQRMPVGKGLSRHGDGRFALQGRGQLGIEQAVQAADEDAGDRSNAVNGLSGSKTAFNAALVGRLHRCQLAGGKNQRHIDIDAIRNRIGDGTEAGSGCRNLDHGVRSVNGLPEAASSGKGAGSIVGQGWRNLETDEAGTASALRVQGQKQIAGALHIG